MNCPLRMLRRPQRSGSASQPAAPRGSRLRLPALRAHLLQLRLEGGDAMGESFLELLAFPAQRRLAPLDIGKLRLALPHQGAQLLAESLLLCRCFSLLLLGGLSRRARRLLRRRPILRLAGMLCGGLRGARLGCVQALAAFAEL